MIVIADLKNNGSMEFFSVNELEVLGTAEHSMATELEWDPSGRFVATGASAWRHQVRKKFISFFIFFSPHHSYNK
jgi:translation initiation factor 3 subunit B